MTERKGYVDIPTKLTLSFQSKLTPLKKFP